MKNSLKYFLGPVFIVSLISGSRLMSSDAHQPGGGSHKAENAVNVSHDSNPIGTINFHRLIVSKSNPGKYQELKGDGLSLIFLEVDYSKPFGQALEEGIAKYRKANPQNSFFKLLKPQDKIKFNYVEFLSCGGEFKTITRDEKNLKKTLYELQDGKKGNTAACSNILASIRIE